MACRQLGSLDDEREQRRRQKEQEQQQAQQAQCQALPPWQPWAAPTPQQGQQAPVGNQQQQAQHQTPHSQQQQPHQQQQQPQQHQQQQPALTAKQEQARQQRVLEKEASKAAAKAAAAGQPRPKPPKGPCGTPCAVPASGVTHPLPLASALQKNCPPWNARHMSDLSLVRLWEAPHDALQVRFPAGSSTPSSGRRGGVNLAGTPACLPARDCLLQFDFKTAPDFDWTRGGKLGGGLKIGQGAATGYRHSTTAASARVTWGPEGSIMFYAYTMEGTQQDPGYTQVAKLGGGCGDHLFPQTFRVQRGAWNSVQLRVRLNTPGRADGVAGLGVNGQYREFDSMVWRSSADSLITEVMLVTFFGGSWSTPIDTSIDFANFSITVLE